MKTIVGGWNISPTVSVDIMPMTNEQNDLFENAVGQIDGAGYLPLCYIGNQLVNGQLHAYIALQTLIHQENTPENVVKVVIHQPLEGEPTIHTINEF